jgi:hypothetical protein
MPPADRDHFPSPAAKLEGQFTFSRAAVSQAPDGELVVELTDEAGHVVRVAFKSADLKGLIGWRLLIGL